MAQEYEIVKGFQTQNGLGLYDYDCLANKPNVATSKTAGLLSAGDKQKIDTIDGLTGGLETTQKELETAQKELIATKEALAATKTDLQGKIDQVNESINGIEIPVVSVNNKTGEVNISKEDVDLGNVDNTSDMNKPLSNPQAAAVNTAIGEAIVAANAYTNEQLLSYKIEVDPNLSTEGKAADSKVTGDAIKNIKDLLIYTDIEEDTDEIKTLYSDEDKTEVLYPRTKIDAITDSEGANLKDIMASKNYVAEEIGKAQLGENVLNSYVTKQDLKEKNYITGDTEEDANKITAREIKTLYSDEEKTKVLYPRTKTEAIINSEGKNLEEVLGNYATKADVEGVTVTSIGAVPNSRTINDIALDDNITLSASDVDAISASTPQTKNTVLAAPSTANGAPAFRTLVAADLPSHGTHVSYGKSAAALGTSSAGKATTVSRSDHVHAFPALTSCTGTLSVEKGGTGATDAKTARANLGITPANIGITDYVIAQDPYFSSTKWGYRKWKSGIAECWMNTAAKSLTASSQWNGATIYFTDNINTKRVKYPVEFKGTPIVSAQACATYQSGDFWLCASGSYVGSNEFPPMFCALTPTKDAKIDTSISLYVIGRYDPPQEE